MKTQQLLRFILLLGLASLLSISSFAQEAKKKGSFFKIGVKGGMSFTSISVKSENISEIMNNHTGFNVGVAFQMKLPVRGLILQPEILYVSKGATFRGDGMDLDVKMGYVEIPLNIQYGLNLILFKPFIEISPYIGYAVNNAWKSESLVKYVTCRDINRLGYGIGVGGGIDVWRCQIKVKYNWSFGALADIKTPSGAVDQSLGLFVEEINKANFTGLEVSLAFFF